MATAETELPGDVFVDALRETVATMAGLTLEQKGPPSENEASCDCGQITGAMGMFGAKNGYLLIAAEQESVAELVMFMTGIEATDLTENDLCDGMMELVNMVAGAVRKKLAGSDRAFDLSSPWAIIGLKTRIVTKQRVDSYSARLQAGSIRLIIKIIYV